MKGFSCKEYILCLGLGWFPVNPGGLDRYVYELTNSLATDSDTKVELCAIDVPMSSSEDNLSFTSFANSEHGLAKRLWLLRESFVRRNLPSPDAISLHFSLYTWPLLRSLPDAVPRTFTFHGPWALESRAEGDTFLSVALKKWLEKRVYAQCDRFITLSQSFAEILHKQYHIPKDKIHVIPGGINTQAFRISLTRKQAREHLSFPQKRPVLFTPRRLVHRIGIDKLLEALAIVKQQQPDVWLAVAGKGPQREALEKQAQDLGLTDNVKFLGYVPDEDLPICYQAADLTVVPSQALEGFGLILLESLASGTPVVSTPVGGMPEVLRPFDENLVTADSGVDAIGDRLLQFLTGELTLPDREACRNYAVENYDWKIIAPRVKDVLLMPK